MKTKTLTLCALLSIAFAVPAQDPAFLNSSQSLVNLNPSFAGSNGGIRNQLTYFNQWANDSRYGKAYATTLNTFDAYIKPLKGGIAVSAINDMAGSGRLKMSGLSLAYAQHLSFSDGNLKIIPSVQVGYSQKILDINRGLTFGDLIDPRMLTVWDNNAIMPSQKKSYADVSAGLLVNYKKNFYAGVSVFHINQPDAGLLGTSRLPARIVAHASYNLHVSENTLFNFLVKYSAQKIFSVSQAEANAVFFKHLLVGIGYMSNPYTYSNDGLINLGFRGNFMSATLSGSKGIIKKSTYTAASYALNLSFNLRNKEQRKQLTSFESW